MPHAKGRWLVTEHAEWQQQLHTDIATLIGDRACSTDLVEVFCSPNSNLTKTAQDSGMRVERWTKGDFDLATDAGYQSAATRLGYLRPKGLWFSPECGPSSIMQNANQRTPAQVADLAEKRKVALRQWQTCIKLAWLQIELGGTFYIEQPQTCGTWKRKDRSTRQQLERLSVLYQIPVL